MYRIYSGKIFEHMHGLLVIIFKRFTRRKYFVRLYDSTSYTRKYLIVLSYHKCPKLPVFSGNFIPDY